MRKRRSFFLLEAMIAVVLVEMFAFFALQGLYRSLNAQRKMIRALEYEKRVDLKRMEVVERCWSYEGERKLESGKEISFTMKGKPVVLNPEQLFYVSCSPAPRDRFYYLCVQEIRPDEFKPELKKEKKNVQPLYYYFRTKSQDNINPTIKQMTNGASEAKDLLRN